MIPSRLARAVLPIVGNLLALQSQANHDDDANVNASKSRKGKKRARAYEGDELFKTREIICSTKEDGEAVLSALDSKLSHGVSCRSYDPRPHSLASPPAKLSFEHSRTVHHRSHIISDMCLPSPDTA